VGQPSLRALLQEQQGIVAWLVPANLNRSSGSAQRLNLTVPTSHTFCALAVYTTQATEHANLVIAVDDHNQQAGLHVHQMK
jgi:hypothetical protein